MRAEGARASPFFSAVLFAFLALSSAESQTIEHTGMCDASAAVAVGDDMFLVANDEDNILRVYRSDESGKPLQTFNLNRFLKPEKRREADIEAAARAGEVVYWITSHGTNKKGKSRPSRRRLFATKVETSGGKVEVSPVGAPYEGLAESLAASPRLRKFNLGKAAGIPDKSDGGLNIEGLAAAPDGTLLIGFRNPVPGGKALIVTLENPEEVIRGRAAKLGNPVTLPLGGLGISGIEYLEDSGNYLIIAGPRSGRGSFELYKWSGASYDEPERFEGFDSSGLNPEAAAVYPSKRSMVLLSDDGKRRVRGQDCKDAAPGARKFRSIAVPY